MGLPNEWSFSVTWNMKAILRNQQRQKTLIRRDKPTREKIVAPVCLKCDI